jgi:hypothetical protein
MTLGTRRRRPQLDAGRVTRASVEQLFGSGSKPTFAATAQARLEDRSP